MTWRADWASLSFMHLSFLSPPLPLSPTHPLSLRRRLPPSLSPCAGAARPAPRHQLAAVLRLRPRRRCAPPSHSPPRPATALAVAPRTHPRRGARAPGSPRRPATILAAAPDLRARRGTPPPPLPRRPATVLAAAPAMVCGGARLPPATRPARAEAGRRRPASVPRRPRGRLDAAPELRPGRTHAGPRRWRPEARAAPEPYEVATGEHPRARMRWRRPSSPLLPIPRRARPSPSSSSAACGDRAAGPPSSSARGRAPPWGHGAARAPVGTPPSGPWRQRPWRMPARVHGTAAASPRRCSLQIRFSRCGGEPPRAPPTNVGGAGRDGGSSEFRGPGATPAVEETRSRGAPSPWSSSDERSRGAALPPSSGGAPSPRSSPAERGRGARRTSGAAWHPCLEEEERVAPSQRATSALATHMDAYGPPVNDLKSLGTQKCTFGVDRPI